MAEESKSDKLVKRVLLWGGVVPVALGFWSGVGASFVFFDELQRLREKAFSIGEDGLSGIQRYEQRMAIFDYWVKENIIDQVWDDYKERKGIR